MPVLKPKAKHEVQGFQLKKAGTYERGDWVVIDNDEAQILSAQQVSLLYALKGNAGAKAIPSPRAKKTFKKGNSFDISVHGKTIHVQAMVGKILAAAVEIDSGHGFFSSQLQCKGFFVRQISPCLSGAAKIGLIESEKAGSKNSNLWKLTNNGRLIGLEVKKHLEAE